MLKQAIAFIEIALFGKQLVAVRKLRSVPEGALDHEEHNLPQLVKILTGFVLVRNK